MSQQNVERDRSALDGMNGGNWSCQAPGPRGGNGHQLKPLEVHSDQGHDGGRDWRRDLFAIFPDSAPRSRTRATPATS